MFKETFKSFMTPQEIKEKFSYTYRENYLDKSVPNFFVQEKEGNMPDLVNIYKVVRKTPSWNIFESAIIRDEHKIIYPLKQMIRDFKGVGMFGFKTYKNAEDFCNWLKLSDEYEDEIIIMRAKGKVINDNLVINPPLTATVFVTEGKVDMNRATYSWSEDTGTVLCEILQLIEPALDSVSPIISAPWTEWEKSESTYCMGDTIVVDKEEFLLAQVDAQVISLISLEDGNRWSEPTEVKSICKITHKELHSHIIQGGTEYKWHRKE